jgi:CubicO group peptidase (beta-lactamase class C family)
MAVTSSATDIGELERFIEAQLEPFRVPGVAVAIVHGDEVLLCRGFGTRNLDGNLPMTADTVMPIGSVSKSFTSALVATLVDDEKLEWDKPVRDHLPQFRMHDPAATEHMSPRDLLAHRSGLPRHDLVWYGNEELTRAGLVERLRHLEPNVSFRQLWQYNNLMYITAGHLAERLLDVTWEEGVRSRLLEPLGMAATTFSVASAQASADHARPYVLRDQQLREVPFRGLDLAGPAGSINSTVTDMARWAIVHANGGAVGGRQVISAAAMKQLHTAAMVMPDLTEYWPENSSTGYALGWMVDNYRGHRVVQHGGNIDGFSAMVSVMPAQRLGVVVLANRNGTPLRDVIPLHVYDQMLGLEPIPWETRYREMEAAVIAGMREGKSHRAASSQPVPHSHPLDAYAGRYVHPGYGTFSFRVEGDVLAPSYNSNRMQLRHLHYESFELEIEPFEEGQAVPVRFETDDDGEVSAAHIKLEASVDAIEFRKLPDESLSDLAAFARYAGTYALGPIAVEVILDDGTLYAQVAGQPRTKLMPKRLRLFVAGETGTTIEFVEEDGNVVRLVTSGAAFARTV